MSKPAPHFRPINVPLDVSDEALNALGDRLGVPALVRPEPPPAPKANTQSASPPPATVRPPEPPKTIETSVPLQQPAPCPQEKLTIELPAYLTQALRRDCAERRVTQRYLVLQGLQAIGYAVDAADLVPDHRRPQGRAGRS